jgi:hypothetical protein
LAEPFLCHPAAFQCLGQPFLGRHPCGTLNHQFRPNGLESPFAGQPLGIGTVDCLILGETFLGELGLHVTDGSLRLFQQSFDAFPGCCLGPDCLACGFELIGACGLVRSMAAVDDGDRHLAILDESTPLGMRFVGGAGRMARRGSWQGITIQTQSMAHLHLR